MPKRVQDALLEVAGPATTRGGLEIYLRPIIGGDAGLVQALLETLSPHSVYLRFHRHLSCFSPALIRQLTAEEDAQSAVLVALDRRLGPTTMLGMGRVILPSKASVAEFAVVIGEPWQGMGVGAALLERLITVAKDVGVRRLWGLALAQNTGVVRLARKLGCALHYDQGCSQVEITLDLQRDAECLERSPEGKDELLGDLP